MRARIFIENAADLSEHRLVVLDAAIKTKKLADATCMIGTTLVGMWKDLYRPEMVSTFVAVVTQLQRTFGIAYIGVNFDDS